MFLALMPPLRPSNRSMAFNQTERIQRFAHVLMLALVAYLPFEFRTFPVMSNLQWLFLAVAVTATPLMLKRCARRIRTAVGAVYARTSFVESSETHSETPKRAVI